MESMRTFICSDIRKTHHVESYLKMSESLLQAQKTISHLHLNDIFTSAFLMISFNTVVHSKYKLLLTTTLT
jgi:hypothetical protein